MRETGRDKEVSHTNVKGTRADNDERVQLRDFFVISRQPCAPHGGQAQERGNTEIGRRAH